MTIAACGAITPRSPSIIELVAAGNLSLRAGAAIRLWGSERVDEVFWIKGNPPVPLAIVLCPYGGSILKDELSEIARSGVQTLVSLLEPEEADWLGLGEEGALAGQFGMHFISYPIQDVHVPANVQTFRKFVSGLADRLRAGERIGMHCRGSIGRAPLTAACTLIHLGWDAKDALTAIRGGAGLRDSRYRRAVAVDSQLQGAAVRPRMPEARLPNPIPGPNVDLSFPHRWQAEILAARPLILPPRHFVYPRAAEEVERGALEVMIRPEGRMRSHFSPLALWGFAIRRLRPGFGLLQNQKKSALSQEATPT